MFLIQFLWIESGESVSVINWIVKDILRCYFFKYVFCPFPTLLALPGILELSESFSMDTSVPHFVSSQEDS